MLFWLQLLSLLLLLQLFLLLFYLGVLKFVVVFLCYITGIFCLFQLSVLQCVEGYFCCAVLLSMLIEVALHCTVAVL